MKIVLNCEFESVEEMKRELGRLAATTEPVVESKGETPAEKPAEFSPEPAVAEPAPVKPKRKRRTKAQIEADKIAEAAARDAAAKIENKEDAAEEIQAKAAAVESDQKAASGNGADDEAAVKLEYAKRFRAVLAKNYNAAANELGAEWTDTSTGEVHAKGFPRFSVAPLARQAEILDALEGQV